MEIASLSCAFFCNNTSNRLFFHVERVVFYSHSDNNTGYPTCRRHMFSGIDKVSPNYVMSPHVQLHGVFSLTSSTVNCKSSSRESKIESTKHTYSSLFPIFNFNFQKTKKKTTRTLVTLHTLESLRKRF